MILSFLHSSNYSNDLETESSFVLSCTSVYGSVQWIRRIGGSNTAYQDVSSSLGVVCSLCESNPDSHDHLFFECPIASGIWNGVKGLAGLNASNPNIFDIIQDLLPIVKYRITVSVIAKLVVAASAYYVWQERNWRLFKKGSGVMSIRRIQCVAYGRIDLVSFMVFDECRHGYAISSLMDTPYWLSER
nr:reverse transcriptase zinc-binding domain-containing protein [Tanacetum cinerariifolium]